MANQMKMVRFLAVAIGLSGLALLWGCAGPGLRVASVEGVLKPDQIIETATGRSLTPDELIDRLSQERIVFLGELHQHGTLHRRQLQIIQGLWAKYPELVIGLEVFARPEQNLLDRWVRGELAEDDFQKLVLAGVLNRDTFDVYSPLLAWARDNRVPLLALNAPRSVSGQVARGGLDSLTPEQRQWMAEEIRIGPDAYRERVTDAFHGHAMAALRMDDFFAAQVVWDETMAETLVAYLTSQEGHDRKAVVIAGNEHVIFGHGVPDRVARRWSGAQARLLMLVATEDEELSAEAADLIWALAPEPPRRRPRLGVALAAEPAGQLRVTSVVPGSEAERIGLMPGDRLLRMDGREIASSLDLHRVAIEEGTDRDHTLTVDREGRILEFQFRFRDE